MSPARKTRLLDLRTWPQWLRGLGAAIGLAFLFWLLWTPDLLQLNRQPPRRTALMQFRAHQARSQGLRYRLHYAWVPLEAIALPLQHAVIAAEDDVFYQHAGIDWSETWASVQVNLQRGRFAHGGSTITQQVVKNLYLTPHKNLLRKLKEAVLALQLERSLNKRRILELYLNIAEWGPGVFGAEAASQTYFHCSAAELDLDQAVALVAVLPSPLRHSPVCEDPYLQWRKTWVLKRMAALHYAPLADAAEPLPLLPTDEQLRDEEDREAELSPAGTSELVCPAPGIAGSSGDTPTARPEDLSPVLPAPEVQKPTL